MITKLGSIKDYLPVGAPLLDYLATDTEGHTGWKYPKIEELRKFQQKQGLTYSVLEDVEVQEIICGVSPNEDIEKFYDVMLMTEKIFISRESQSFQRHLDDRSVSGLLEDSWKQTPGKIMFGDGLSWCAIMYISSLLEK